MALAQGDMHLKYDFKFDKLGLEPNEYERCLTSKLDILVQDQREEIKNLTKASIRNVEEEVRVRQIGGEKDSRMDKRLKATRKYIDEEYLRDENDTFWKYNEFSGGSQGNEKKTRKWSKEYHESQKILFQKNLVQLSSVVANEDPTVHFCNAIDDVTASLIRALSEKKQLDTTEVMEVYELCGRIVRGRTAVDWAIENNLVMDRFDKWKNHVLVVMSFSALMVVADMIHRNSEGISCAESRSQDICPGYTGFASFFLNYFNCLRCSSI